ncbi:MAG: hypothetical protein ACYS26_05180 [Planctomycetota bacterium]|jgi:hypothetical protein
MGHVRLGALLLAPVVFSSLAAAQSPVRPLPHVHRSETVWRSAPEPVAAEASVSEARAPRARTVSEPVFASPRLVHPLTERADQTFERLSREPGQAESEMFVSLDVGITALHDSNVRDGSGQVAVQRGGWRAVVGRRNQVGDEVALHIESEASFYDFGGATGLTPANDDPFNDLYETRLGASFRSALSQESSAFGGFEIVLGGEDEVQFEEGLTLGGLTGVEVRVHEELALSAGIAAASRLEDDAFVIPFLGFDWRPTEGLRLGAEGPRAEIEVALDDDWSLELAAAYELRQFRLNEDGPANGGAFRDEQIHAAAELAYQPEPGVRLTATVGSALWREYSVLGNDGSLLGEIEPEAGLMVGLGLQLRF